MRYAEFILMSIYILFQVLTFVSMSVIYQVYTSDDGFLQHAIWYIIVMYET